MINHFLFIPPNRIEVLTTFAVDLGMMSLLKNFALHYVAIKKQQLAQREVLLRMQNEENKSPIVVNGFELSDFDNLAALRPTTCVGFIIRKWQRFGLLFQ